VLRTRVNTVLSIVLGSLFFFVPGGEARAQGVPQFVKLFEGDLGAYSVGAPISIAGYREVIVY